MLNSIWVNEESIIYNVILFIGICLLSHSQSLSCEVVFFLLYYRFQRFFVFQREESFLKGYFYVTRCSHKIWVKSLRRLKSGALKHYDVTILLLAQWRNNSVVYFSGGVKLLTSIEAGCRRLDGLGFFYMNLKLVHEPSFWLYYSHVQRRE